MWERAKNWAGPWEEVPYSRVPKRAWRVYSRRVKRGILDLYIPADRYYYRYRFCV